MICGISLRIENTIIERVKKMKTEEQKKVERDAINMIREFYEFSLMKLVHSSQPKFAIITKAADFFADAFDYVDDQFECEKISETVYHEIEQRIRVYTETLEFVYHLKNN